MDGQGQYGRGKDDHGNDDDHDEDHIDDQDNAAFVGPYGGYGDGTYWHGLGYDHGRGGGRGGYGDDCRTKENWRFSANREVCRSGLYNLAGTIVVSNFPEDGKALFKEHYPEAEDVHHQVESCANFRKQDWKPGWVNLGSNNPEVESVAKKLVL